MHGPARDTDLTKKINYIENHRTSRRDVCGFLYICQLSRVQVMGMQICYMVEFYCSCSPSFLACMRISLDVV